MNRLAILFAVIVAALSGVVRAADAPAALPPLPTTRQLEWENRNLALLAQFGINTFTGKDLGDGKEDPKLFNPAKLDVKQWVATAKDCGFNRILLTAKGREGFCLWPTATTDFSVKNSPWENGQGDVVKEFTDAARAAGLEVGLGFAPMDRHGSVNVDIQQITELLTSYGPIDELRIDGAETTGQTFDWPAFIAAIRRLQPNIIIQSNNGPDARWNGNNIGHAGEPNWAPFDPAALPGFAPTKAQLSVLNSGSPTGLIWLPAECCVPIRAHRYWEAADDAKLEAPARLFSAICKSTGRNCVMMLEIPPNDQGLIPDGDVQLLHTVHGMLQAAFANDLAAGKPVTASNVRGDDPHFAAANAVDDNPETYWATDDSVTGDCWLQVDLGQPTKFNIAAMAEPIALGQRVATYEVQYLDGDTWTSVAATKVPINGRSIGHLKYERFDTVTASKVRLYIKTSRAAPLISRFSLYYNGN